MINHQVWTGPRDNRHPADGTLIFGAVIMDTNGPIAIDEAFMTALWAVESGLPRRGIFGRLVGSQHVYIYRLQAENPRDSTLPEESIMETAQDGDSDE